MRDFRRLFSRSEWAVRILGLRRFAYVKQPGLILLQIDGLARPQLEKALSAGEMPFIQSLLEREEYRLWSHYSGQPSTTPAVQGELFYGARSAVPAFTFRDKSGKSHSMLRAASATMIERRLADKGRDPLLAGGSAYADVYTGGAENAAFCVSNAGTGAGPSHRGGARRLVALLMYGTMAPRVAALEVIEVALAAVDFLRGFFKRKNVLKELLFIPTRVGICVLLRELATTWAILDATRGVPIIHCNFLGYDEQSHRRGPSSRFAHWTLSGIDDCLSRIWRAARRSGCRDYELWIYSDHGQEHATPYAVEYGKKITAAVEESLHAAGFEDLRVVSGEPQTIQLQRAVMLGREVVEHPNPRRHNQDTKKVHINAKGPVGSVYLPGRFTKNALERIARAIVAEAGVPAVLLPLPSRRAVAFTPRGRFILPRDIEQVVGPKHPFPEDVGRDLVDGIVHNPLAGDLILLGWRNQRRPLTFPIENGAHAGPGYDETHAFAVLPRDCPLDKSHKGFLRPADVRNAALRLIHHPPAPFVSDRPRRRDPSLLRIMTYNVHSCIGLDGRHSYDRLARIIARYDPDVVALQELDVGKKRSSGVDQARLIAEALNMRVHFHPSVVIEDEQYGNALLSRLPMDLVKAGALPGLPGREQRGALWVRVQTPRGAVQVLTTHLGLRSAERVVQVRDLTGERWLANPRCAPPIVVCGDFNMSAGSREYRMMTRMVRDSKSAAPRRSFQRTWMGISRIDYIFAAHSLEFRAVRVPRTHLTRVASDHFPLLADLAIV
jgi:endonuclease/exonuclease/phosphatase family metal-dependent hydrolase